MRIRSVLLAGIVVAGLAACGGTSATKGATAADAGTTGAGASDAGTMDAGTTDAGVTDPGTSDAGVPDAGVPDAGVPDAGVPDAGVPDAGVPDAGAPDAGFPDAGAPDAGVPDAGVPDAGAPDAGAPDAGAPDAGVPDAGVPDDALLLNGANPMPCADPAVFSAEDLEQTYYVYCTGMSHVWKTSDWSHFSDVRSSTTFDLTGMSTNGQAIKSWWAPGIVYAPQAAEYVMWVSVPDELAVKTSTGWDTRSLAVFTSPTPTGTWTYRGLAYQATASGQNYIDPFLFLDHDGGHYVYFKQYGGGLSSSIMGAQVGSGWQKPVAGTEVEIMNGYGGPGTWEDNVRENPAIRYDPSTGLYHLLFSGGHWRDDTYATGHALSNCGPLCVGTSGGWHIVSSGDRGIVQAVQSNGDANFAYGGPGGAVFQDDTADFIIYAAAPLSPSGDHTRYLMRDPIRWANRAPYVDTAGHFPHGY